MNLPARVLRPTGAELGEGALAELWRVGAEESADAIVGLDRDGLVVAWSRGAVRVFDYAVSDVRGRPSAMLLVAGQAEQHAERVRRVLAGERLARLSVTARRRDGMTMPVSVTMVPVAEGQGVCMVVRDVTEQEVAQATLAESDLRLRETQELAHVGLWLWDAAADTVQLSDELYRIHGLDPLRYDDALDTYLELVHPEDRPGLEHDLRAALDGAQVLEREHRVVRPDGSVRWVYVRAAVERDADGCGVALRGICQDVTERVRAAASLERQAALLELVRGMAEAANQASSFHEALLACLRDLCEHAGWPVGHAFLVDGGRAVSSGLWHLVDGDRFGAFRSQSERTSSRADSSLIGRVLASGRPIWVPDLEQDVGFTRARAASEAGLTTAFAFPVVEDDQVVAVLEFFSTERRSRDEQLIEAAVHGAIQLSLVVERERSRDALARQALHDPLTDLPNRELFRDRLSRAVARLERQQSHLAVVFVDLDNLKLINDSLGHNVGDELLTTIAQRLTAAVRPGDTVARFGGDEFMILCDRLSTEEAAVEIADALLQEIAVPIELQPGIDTVVTASAGIVIVSTPDANPQELMRDADSAMYRAKEAGGARYLVFNRDLHQRATRKLAIASELRKAVENRELVLHYQPQVDISDGSLVGVEALVRWEHPERGRLSPAEFIPIAEETQLVVPMGAWVLREACRQAAEWQRLSAAGRSLKMCVNVSAHQLSRPDLIDVMAVALADSGIDPATLCLEITESVLMADAEACLEALLALKMLGVSLAVDDFGTGYSSLAYLSRFPIDVIKIDKGFVDELGRSDRRAQAIVNAVVDLSRALGVQSLAEGVETLAQVDDLRTARCEVAQGYYFHRPQPAGEISELLRARAGATVDAGFRD